MDIPTVFPFTTYVGRGLIHLSSSWSIKTKWTFEDLTCVMLRRECGTGRVLVEVTLEQWRTEQMLWHKNVFAHFEDGEIMIQLFSPLLVPFQEMDKFKGRVAIFGPNHDSALDLSKDVLHLLDPQNSLSDATLKCGQVEIPVHKCILSARSPVFAAMFQSQMLEGKSGKVDIVDIEVRVLQYMLRYFYGGQIDDLTDEMAENLLFASDKYRADSLKQICTNKLKSVLSKDNVFHILVLGDLHDADLKAHAMEFIFSFKQFSDLKETEGWKTLHAGYPNLETEVLNLQGLSCKRRSQTFKIAVIYKGGRFTFEVAESDTVKVVKEKIQVKMDIPKDQQKLHDSSRKELEDFFSLSYYDILEEHTLYLERNCIFVSHYPLERTYTLKFDPTSTIKEVKLMLPIQECIGHINFIFEGRELEDNQTLADCQIVNHSTIAAFCQKYL